jgi:hypothetical protein
VILLVLDDSIGINHSYIWHHYGLQGTLVLKAVRVFYVTEYCGPFMADPAPTTNEQETTAYGDTHKLTVITLSPWSVS